MLLALAGIVATAVFVQVAIAATPNSVQYDNTTTTTTTAVTPTTTGAVGGKTQNAPKPAKIPAAKAGGTLPFTGFDLGIAAAGGALFLVGGVALRRAGRKNRPNA